MATDLPELLLPDAAAWRAWLLVHHAESPGVRLVLYKKGGSATGLVHAAALEVALCFGWIDGQLSRRDEGSYCIRFTPRRSASKWSARNVEHVGRLTAAGLMHESGLAAVAAAKADGRWDAAYAGSAVAEPPPDLLAALASEPTALEAYGKLNATNRYALYYRLHTVKGAETRRRKIAAFVEMLANGRAPYAQDGFAAPK